jgi:transcriptional regulator with GAF, ATPase, and Fis domain
VFARQYESERVQRQRLDTLLDVASIAASEQRLDDVLQILARAERAATGADVCALYIFDESGDSVLAAYQDGIRQDEEEAVFIASQGISVTEVPAEMQVRRTLEPAIIRDVVQELSPDSAFARYALRECISEILLIPIVWQSEVVGVMYCWYRRSEERFSRTAIETAEAIAHQAGGVVSRARLEATIQRQTEESEALLRIGQAVLTSETLGPVLDEIAAAFQQLIPFDYCYVGMLTGDGKNIRVVREWGTNYKSIHNALIPVDASISGISIKAGELVTTDRMTEDPRAWKQVRPGRPVEAIAVTATSTSQARSCPYVNGKCPATIVKTTGSVR